MQNRELLSFFALYFGKMQEWLNWPAWKASKPQKGFRGSNPLLSAKTKSKTEANPCKSRIYRDFYFGRNAEKSIEKQVICDLFGVLFFGQKKYTELLVIGCFAHVCSALPLDMRHLGN